MKTYSLLLSLSLIYCFAFTPLFACDNSGLSLVSYTDNGTSHVYEVQVCIGGGVLGIDRGADGPTTTFALAVYTGGAAVTISNFTPSLTSTETGVSMNATTTGPLGSGFNNADESLAYIHPGGTAFTCISSTALCGEPHSDCFDISFTTSEELETISLFGVEGNGNPTAGCTGEADMTIDFSALPVTFKNFAAQTAKENVRLNWQTASEYNNSHFVIERSADGRNFRTIGTVVGAGDSDQLLSYSYTDEKAPAGTNYYRLQQVDFSGEFSFSPVVIIKKEETFSVLLSPNPARNMLSIQATSNASDELLTLQIFDSTGRLLFTQHKVQASAYELSLAYLPAGVYTLHVLSNGQVASQRFVKLRG